MPRNGTPPNIKAYYFVVRKREILHAKSEVLNKIEEFLSFGSTLVKKNCGLKGNAMCFYE